MKFNLENSSAMTNKIFLYCLFSCTLCAGQSVLTTPGSLTQPSPDVPGIGDATQSSQTDSGGNDTTQSLSNILKGLQNGSASKSKSSTDTGPKVGNDNNPTPPPASKVAGPLTDRSDFQQFAEDAAGHPLLVYGRQLFDEVPSTFAPMDRIPVPANYVIGPGDELLITAWGKVDLDARVTVDRDGQIALPKVGTLSVAGLRYDQLEECLHKAIGNLYKDFELNVAMGQLRSIQVFVLGSARQPGAYTVSSLSTLVNALLASGGPSATGSMRRIQLRRADHLLTEFDVYDLLRSGDKSHDQQLLPGDVIYIPPVGPQVAILGSVNEPGIFELKGDATIAAVMKDAGGLTILARSDKVVLERIEKYGKRRVEEFALDVPGLQREFRDGDILRLFPISPKFENAVTLRGNVAQPGRFVWHEGMRVSDLISSRDALLTRSHWNAQNHLTGNIPRKVLTRELGSTWDPLTGDLNADANALSDSKTGRDSADPQSLLNVDKTADAPALTDDHWEQQNQLAESSYKDLAKEIGKTSAEINWDYASIERLDEHDLSTRLIAFNLGNAIDNPSSVDNRTLKSGDVLTVFSRKDLPLPIEKRATFITVGGEVNAPGVYRVNPGDSLRNVVERAGGLTSHSYLYASQLTRESTRQAEEEQLKQSVAQLQRELISRFAGATSLSATDALDQKTQFNSQRAEIAQLAGIRPTGRIVLDMKPDAASVGEVPEFPLEDGDSFYIPPRLGTVQVAGAVYNESAFRYQPHKRFPAYLGDAGGPTRQADKRRAFIIRADGTVVSRQSRSLLRHGNFENLILLPGDAIIIPTKLKTPGGFMQQLPFMTQIMSQTAMIGALVGTRL